MSKATPAHPAAPTGLQRFSIHGLPEEPWRNGGGITRTVARCQRAGETRWRLSVADITGEGPFSTFPGLDREAVLLDGDGITLRGAGGAWTLRRVGDAARFPGDFPLRGAPDGPRVRLWNAMACRRLLRMRTLVRHSVCARIEPVAAGALLVLDGVAGIQAHGQGQDLHAPRALTALAAGEGLVFDDWREVLTLRALAGPVHWLLTTFEPR